MQPKKIVWSWFDGDGTYVNQAGSLEEIIVEIVECYFDEEANVKVRKFDQHFELELWDGTRGCKKIYRVQNCNPSVAEFLGNLAKEEGRPDQFSIEAMG